MVVLELMGGLICWEVVTVKDEKVAEATPLHGAINLKTSLTLPSQRDEIGDEIVSAECCLVPFKWPSFLNKSDKNL